MAALLLALLLAAAAAASAETDFSRDFEFTWGDGRGKVDDSGRQLTLSLDRVSGSGFRSKNQYLFGKIDMKIRLVPNNSAGTVTTFYMSSEGPAHDEIDFEFLGNSTGEPYTLHTNVYTQGKGDREQQFRLWFDPTKQFHTYSITWNPQHILFSVDGTPIRDFKNMEARGVAFPKQQPMKVYASLWNADDWATQGGRVKTDWSQAPFAASFREFAADACVLASGGPRCGAAAAGGGGKVGALASGGGAAEKEWWTQQLDGASYRRMRWVQRKFMIYNYCDDRKRFRDVPTECRRVR